MTHIYGINALFEAIVSEHRKIDKVFVQKGKKGKEIKKIIDAAKGRNIPVMYENGNVLTMVVATDKHQGVVGFAGEKDYSSLEGLLECGIDSGRKPFYVILDGLTDPRNVGATIRTAEAAGADGVIVPSRRNAGMNATVAKTSAGALEHIPICRVTNIARAIDEMKKNGVWVYGLDVRSRKSYFDIDYTQSIAVVLGNEEKGLRRLTEQCCDELVSIPLVGSVESLNVSVALGVFGYEVLRQRTRG